MQSYSTSPEVQQCAFDVLKCSSYNSNTKTHLHAAGGLVAIATAISNHTALFLPDLVAVLKSWETLTSLMKPARVSDNLVKCAASDTASCMQETDINADVGAKAWVDILRAKTAGPSLWYVTMHI